MQKAEARRIGRAKRRGLSESESREASRRIAGLLRELPEYADASAVLFYAALPEEVETRAMIERALADGKKVLLPKANREARTLSLYAIQAIQDLVPGSYGILEPQEDKARAFPAEDLDLAVIPGIAYDRKGNRVGFGAGYYDRLLAELQGRAALVGLAFAGQLMRCIKTSRMDLPMDIVITEEEVVRVRE